MRKNCVSFVQTTWQNLWVGCRMSYISSGDSFQTLYTLWKKLSIYPYRATFKSTLLPHPNTNSRPPLNANFFTVSTSPIIAITKLIKRKGT